MKKKPVLYPVASPCFLAVAIATVLFWGIVSHVVQTSAMFDETCNVLASIISAAAFMACAIEDNKKWWPNKNRGYWLLALMYSLSILFCWSSLLTASSLL